MKIKYILKQNDFLQYHLYESSQDDVKKNRRKFIAIYAGIFLVASIFSFISNNYFVAFFFLLTTIAIIFIVPSRLKEASFNYNLRVVKDRYINKTNICYDFTLNDNSIELISENFSSKYNVNELVKIVETKVGFYLILKSNFIIIPKSNDVDEKDVNDKLSAFSKKMHINYEKNVNWRW